LPRSLPLVSPFGLTCGQATLTAPDGPVFHISSDGVSLPAIKTFAGYPNFLWVTQGRANCGAALVVFSSSLIICGQI